MRKKEMIERIERLEGRVGYLRDWRKAGGPFLIVIGDTYDSTGICPKIDHIPIADVAEKILKHLKLNARVTPSKKRGIDLVPIEVKKGGKPKT